MVFQIFLILFAIFGLVRAGKQYNTHKISRHWFALWGLVWVLLILAAIFPSVIDNLAHAVGVERGADLLLYISVVVLIYATFRTMVLTQKLSEEHTELVRQIALHNAKEASNKVGSM
jgi:hypothetical protein